MSEKRDTGFKDILLLLLALIPPLTCTVISAYSALPQRLSDLWIVGSYVGLIALVIALTQVWRLFPAPEEPPDEPKESKRATLEDTFLLPKEQEMPTPFRFVRLGRRMFQAIGGMIAVTALVIAIPFILAESDRASEFSVAVNGLCGLLVVVLMLDALSQAMRGRKSTPPNQRLED
jgi:hypothetical protein